MVRQTMRDSIEGIIRRATGASALTNVGVLQRLWSGDGSIVRYAIEGSSMDSVIVKHVTPPNQQNHPRGWNSDRSHQRKCHSYLVETQWYRRYAARCNRYARVPSCLAVERQGDEVVMVLEDLDAAGYPIRRSTVNKSELYACVSWLAHFHATFMGEQPDGLWERGTYWHLATRPDELEVLSREDPALFHAAEQVDAKLQSARFQTLVHGDAKLANFCFSNNGQAVAAVDFQYVGAGCGVQDLAYFIGSCLSEDDCELQEQALLEFYFRELRNALAQQSADLDVAALEAEWRGLYPIAWTDFHRFLKGWSPGHWKINSYSERIARAVVATF